MRLGVCVDERQRLAGKITDVEVRALTKWVELLIIEEGERLTPTELELLRDNRRRDQGLAPTTP